MPEPFKLRIESEADLTGLNAYMAELPKLDASQQKAEQGLAEMGGEAKKTELTFGQLEKELAQARLALSMLVPSDSRLPQLQQHIGGIERELMKARGGMQGFRGDVGQSALMMAQFADDAQYGLRGIMNNVPGLVMALGGGAGLAGVLSIGLLAASKLWDAFSGAGEAKEKTDGVKEAVKRMDLALQQASEEAEKVWSADIAAYEGQIDRATGAWEKQVSQIEKALGLQNEMAKAQLAIAQAQMEIARQTALGGAKSDEERKVINADFDSRKSALTGKADVASAGRAVEAQVVLQDMLKQQFSALSRRRGEASGAVFENDRARADFAGRYGGMSDQGIQVKKAEEAGKKLVELEKQQRALNEALPTAGEGAQGIALELGRVEKLIEAAKKDRAASLPGLDTARQKLAAGDLTFAEPAADADAGTKARVAEAQKEARRLTDERAAKAQAIDEIDASLRKNREAQLDAEKKITLLKLQQQAALEKQAAEFAKAGMDKIIADQQAAEAQKKKQAEEQQRKLDNDAKAAERGDDPVKAAEARNRAEKNKLGPDATGEQKRSFELEAKERIDKARKQQRSSNNRDDAESIGEKAGNLGSNLGEAGSELRAAAAKIKDGATGEEMTKLIAAFRELAPVIMQRFAGNEKKMSELLADMNKLREQLKNSR